MKSPKPLTLLLFVLAALFTISSNTLIEKYQSSSRQLLENPLFSIGLQGWQTKESPGRAIVLKDGTVILKSLDKEGQIEIYQEVKGQGQNTRYRLEAELQTTDVASGEKSWNKARLLLIPIIDGKASYKLKHAAASLVGSQDWKTYSEVFQIPKGVQTIRVVAQMSRCSGEFSLRNPTLYRVVETPLYTFSKWLVISLWATFFFSLFQPCLRTKGNFFFKILLVLTVVAIVIGTAIPGQLKNDLRDDLLRESGIFTIPVQQTVKEIMVAEDLRPFDVPKVDITKLAHFFLFALFALLLLFTNPEMSVKQLLLNLFLVACSTELIQLYVEGRSSLIRDVAIDMAGGGIILLCWQLTTIRKRVCFYYCDNFSRR
ncbi:MAG: VanZ family protein [Pseudomonadota bacterium]